VAAARIGLDPDYHGYQAVAPLRLGKENPGILCIASLPRLSGRGSLAALPLPVPVSRKYSYYHGYQAVAPLRRGCPVHNQKSPLSDYHGYQAVAPLRRE